MSIITTERVPDGSYAIRIFDAGDNPQTSPIKFVGLFKREADDVAELGLAMGNLSAERYILLGRTAWELGFRVLKFHMAKGKRTSRRATLVRSDACYDYYEIDLQKALRQVEQESSGM